MHKLTRILLTSVVTGLLLSLSAGCSPKAKAHRHLTRGDKYFDSGQYSKAEVEYLNVLQLDSLNARALARLGTVYYEQGRTARAYAFLTKASELATNDMDVHVKIGTILMSAGKAKEAQEQASLVLDKMPTNAEAPVLLAESISSRTNAGQVRRRLEKLSAQIGDTAALQLAFGTLHFREGDTNAAETAFKRALTLDPRSSGAHYGLGTLSWAQNDLKAADSDLKIAAELSTVRSFRRIKYADFKIKTGNLENGKLLLTEITKTAPDYLPAWIFAAEIALAQTNYSSCASLLNQALARDADNYEGLLLKGRLELARGEASNAIADLSHMSTIFGSSPQVQYQLGLAHLLNNDTGKALKCLNQAISLNTNYVEAILVLAGLNIRKGDARSAANSLTQLIKQRPQIAQAYLLLANAYSVQNKPNDVIAVYNQMIRFFPKSPQIPLLMGIALAEQGKPEEARQAFVRCLDLAPDFLPAKEQLLSIEISQKNYTGAFESVQRELKKHPDSAGLNFLLAKVHLARALDFAAQEARNTTGDGTITLKLAGVPKAQPDVAQAEAAVLKAIELDPNLQPAYLFLARLYVASNKHQQALDRLATLLVKTNNEVALMQMGVIQEQLKNFEASRDAFEKLITLNSNSAAALNNLSFLYCEHLNQPLRGYQLADRARQLLPSSPYTADTLGWVLFRRGEYVRAIGLLQEGASGLPWDPEVQYHLGMAHYMLGEEGSARAALQRAAGGSADFPGKKEAERHLGILALDPKNGRTADLAGLEKQLENQPGDPVLAIRVASIYEHDGKPERASTVYEIALKQNPKSVPTLLRLALLNSGALHNPERALELAKEAYKLSQDDPETSSVLGRLVFEAGDHKRAVSLLQAGSGKLSADPEVLYDLALAYYSVGRVSDAEAAMRSAVDAHGSFSRINEAARFLDLVPISANPAKVLAAEPRAQEILKTDSNSVPGLMIIGLCAERRNNPQIARQTYEHILSLYPDFLPAIKHIALLYADLGNDQKAYEMANKAREALPDDLEIAKTLGVILYRRGDYKNSARLLNESIQKGGEDGSAMYYLGMACYHLFREQKQTRESERNSSKAALERALVLNVQAKFADEAKRILAELK